MSPIERLPSQDLEFATLPLPSQYSSKTPKLGLLEADLSQSPRKNYLRGENATSSFSLGDIKEPEKNPYIAGVLASVFPGAGYFYIDDYDKGALAGTLIIPLAGHYYFKLREEPAWVLFTQTASMFFGLTVYDTFQDSIDINSKTYAEMVWKPEKYKLSELYFSPFLSQTYKMETKEEDYLGMGGPENDWGVKILALALPTYEILQNTENLVGTISNEGIHPSVEPLEAVAMVSVLSAVSLLVASNEEAEFRGFQMSAFSQLAGTPMLGNLLQAVSFGVAHVKWGFFGRPYFTSNLFALTNTTGLERNRAELPRRQDIGDLLSQTSFGLSQGYLVATHQDGLLTATALHALIDALSMTERYFRTGQWSLGGNVSLSFNF